MKTTPAIAVLALMIVFKYTAISAQDLVVYSEIPGRAPSDKYQCRVKLEGSNEWQSSFVLQTTSNPEASSDGDNGYTEHLRGWSASWINFEMENKPVVVEISKVSGEPIIKAKVRPESKAAPAVIENGKAYVTFYSPANLNVDIDGQMEDQYTGMGYSGPPVHTISLFGNPVIKDRPDKNGARVHYLEPGKQVPSQDTWDLLYFAPGVHDIGVGFQPYSDKALYIPGDAVVHGTMNIPGENVRIYGYGTLSGESVPRGNKTFSGQNGNGRLEGITVADPAFHTCILYGIGITVRHLKIFGWRINGDGPSVGPNGVVEKCFLRTQDDTFPYWHTGVVVRNNVIWNDWNGAAFFMAHAEEGSEFSDINVIYHRAFWHYWTEGGRVFSFRNADGRTLQDIIYSNILIEDPLPAFPPFYFTMRNENGSINMRNILIENAVQDAPGVAGIWDNEYGKPQNSMIGGFKDITFKNCRYNGVWLESFEDGDFLENGAHSNIKFIKDLSPIDDDLSRFAPMDNSPTIQANQGALTIKLKKNGVVSLEIVDVMGKIQIQRMVKTSVPIRCNLPPGAYLARIQSDSKTHLQRFFINPG